MIYAEPVDDALKVLPSPDDLKNKVIIKAKKLASTDEVDGQDDDESGDDEAESDNESVSSLQDEIIEAKSEAKNVTAENSAGKSCKEFKILKRTLV